MASQKFGNLGLQNDNTNVKNVGKRSPVTAMSICEVIYKPDRTYRKAWTDSPGWAGILAMYSRLNLPFCSGSEMGDFDFFISPLVRRGEARETHEKDNSPALANCCDVG